MCGIVGAVSQRNIVPILVEGLKRLEYRGYDSCGVAVHQGGELKRARSTSRVAELEANVQREGVAAGTGIAHTRWATHGAPAVHNAHPHFSAGPGVDAMNPGFGALDGASAAAPWRVRCPQVPPAPGWTARRRSAAGPADAGRWHRVPS